MQKYFEEHRAVKLAGTPLWKALLPLIEAGEVFPAIRKNQVDFYENGARLFSFTLGFKTNGAYVSADKPRRDISVNDLAKSQEDAEKLLATVRFRAAKHREPREDRAASELRAVHELIRQFSPFSGKADKSEPLLIDLEASFSGLVDTKRDMVDLAFLTPDRRLLFIEAKRQSDSRCRSATAPEVETIQVKRYRECVSRPTLAETYAGVLAAFDKLFGSELAGGPLHVWDDVPILIINPDGYTEKKNSRERWQRAALERASLSLNERRALNPHSDVIDGTRDPAAAIIRYAEEIATFDQQRS
nr:hypothetical protein [uncultured Sphingomonas sp.]